MVKADLFRVQSGSFPLALGEYTWKRFWETFSRKRFTYRLIVRAQSALTCRSPGPTHPAQQEHQGMAGVLPLNAALLTGVQLRSARRLEVSLARWEEAQTKPY